MKSRGNDAKSATRTAPCPSDADEACAWLEAESGAAVWGMAGVAGGREGGGGIGEVASRE